MCGIIGYLQREPEPRQPVGRVLLSMLQALSCRGPDSTGIAVFHTPQPHWLLQIKLPEHDDPATATHAIVEALTATVGVISACRIGAYLRVETPPGTDVGSVEQSLLRRVSGAEVVSLGRQLEVVKQVGSPEQLEKDYNVGSWVGSHGIGHTRLSTESRVDLSHSQPFWAHGVADLVTVHNGHVTNYHKLRRRYEQRGHRFYTENDSEVIGVYLRERLHSGWTFEDALRASLDDFDGSFCYLAATGTQLAFVKDRFGFKPLVVAETPRFVAIATEEIALRRALGRNFIACEPAPGTMRVWTVQQEESCATANRGS